MMDTVFVKSVAICVIQVALLNTALPDSATSVTLINS